MKVEHSQDLVFEPQEILSVVAAFGNVHVIILLGTLLGALLETLLKPPLISLFRNTVGKLCLKTC